MFKVGDRVSCPANGLYNVKVVSFYEYHERMTVGINEDGLMVTVVKTACYLELPIVEIIGE